MSSFFKNRALFWLEITALIGAGVFFVFHGLPCAWQSLNTDFPNYYIAARLVRDHQDTSRIYEWSWLQRQKDHYGINIPVIGLLPITPFSTLIIWPLAELQPLIAKHLWILTNLFFLFSIAWILQRLTKLGYRRIALLLLLSFPLYRNLLYGQFYILILLILCAAALSYVHGHHVTSGALIAIAGVCKIFPFLLLLCFVRRKDWSALLSAVVTAILAVLFAIGIFGLQAHRIWLFEILPWVMRGEGLGTYAPSPSISGVLHRLFLSEPQWNPHPWHASITAYAWLSSAIPILLLAPAILLISEKDRSPKRVLLEWCSLLTAALTISTIPASYNFVLMIFPVGIVAAELLHSGRKPALCFLVFAYLVIGFPFPIPNNPPGVTILAYIPRLPMMIGVLLGTYYLLSAMSHGQTPRRMETNYVWAAALAAVALYHVHSTLHIEQAERTEYAYRISPTNQGFLSSMPQIEGSNLRYIAFTLSGYRLISARHAARSSGPQSAGVPDDLSFTATTRQILLERMLQRESRIIEPTTGNLIASNAHDPMIALNGQDLAFLRDDHGRSRLILRRQFRAKNTDISLSPLTQNVYEASFLSLNEYAYAAATNGGGPMLFIHDSRHGVAWTTLANARYPAFSPDGQWLAYSTLDHGVWNLSLRSENTGDLHRIARVPCNQIQPSWEQDSKTIVYGTDCGRSLWFTAIAIRKVLP